jgi:uncharacterized membrane protein YhaH (DUF805 family)
MQCDKILIVPEKEKQKSFKIKFGRQSFFGGWGVVALVHYMYNVLTPYFLTKIQTNELLFLSLSQ